MDTSLPEIAGTAEKGSDLVESRRPFTYAGDGPDVWSNPVSSMTFRGLLGLPQDFAPVSMNEAIQQSAVMACLDIMAQDIAAAPLTLNRLLTQGRRRRGYETIGPKDHPLARLFWLRPNRFMTWWEFTTMVVYHLGLLSNAFIIPVRNRLLQVVELIPVLPTRVMQDVDQGSGRVIYRVRAANAAEALQYGGDDEMIFFADEIIHIKTRVINGFSGLSTMHVGGRIMSLTEAVTLFQDRVYRRDGTLRGVFEMPAGAELSQIQYDRLKTSLGEALNLLRAVGYPLVLEGGTTFKPISMTAEQAEAKEAFGQQIEETARLFRIPPHKLMHFTGVKYDNMDPLERMYVRDSLDRPRCQPIEAALSAHLLTPEEQMDLYVEFDRHELYQTDPNSLSKRTVSEWEKGLITRDEAREALGRNPSGSTAGDVFMLPANTYLVDLSNEVVVTNQASPGDPGAQGGDGDGTTNDSGDE